MLRLNLNKKILLIFSACLITLFGCNLYLFRIAQQEEMDAIRDQWVNHAENFNSQVGSQFFERYGDVQAFAQNAILRNGKPGEIARALNRFVSLYQIYDLIVYADTKGNVVASSTQDPQGRELDISGLERMNFAQTPWYVAAVSEKYTEDPVKMLTGTYVEDIQMDPISSQVYKEQRIGMSFSTAVHNADGQVIGVLSSRSSLRWLEHEITGLYERIADGPLQNSEMTLLNKRGDLVVDYDPQTQKNRSIVHDFEVLLKVNLAQLGHPAAQAALRGEHGVMEAMHARKHIPQINIFTPVKDEGFLDSLGWCFLLRIDENALFRNVYATRLMFYSAGSLVFLLCLAVASFFAMRVSRQLQSISGGIKETGAAVDGYSQQLSQASDSLASSATEVAASLEETVASLEELVSMVKINAENSEQASTLAKASSQTAKEGEREVQSLILAINEINQSSRKIEEIINVIDDIAFQTNLLALNAAVEAARAGDQGRGFAVVAEAVRNLAQRSGTAAKEITKLIQDNGDKIDQGTRIAYRSGQVLQNILKSATKVADLNHEIAAASREQSTGLTQISKAMNEIDQATQRNAAASEQVSTSSSELKGRADALKTMMHRLSMLVTARDEAAQSPANTPIKATAPNVTPLRTPAKRPGPKLVKPTTSVKPKADEMIPFDDEPEVKIGNTKGF